MYTANSHTTPTLSIHTASVSSLSGSLPYTQKTLHKNACENKHASKNETCNNCGREKHTDAEMNYEFRQF